MKLLVAVPAFNESANLTEVINEIRQYVLESTIVVIDDGSTDNSAQVAKNLNAIVLELPFNLGVGGALRTAFKYAERYDFTHLVQIDADGQHEPKHVSKLIDGLELSDIVVGSRFADKSFSYDASRMRRLAMIWLSFLASRVCGTKLTDVTSGFRIANRSAIELFAKHYPTEYLGDTVESLVIAKRAGLRISEVPVRMRSRLSGSPSQSVIRSTWYLARATLVIFLAFLHVQPKEFKVENA